MSADAGLTYSWKASPVNNNWFNGANWNGDGNYPGNGSTVTVATGASILLTNETAQLSAFTMTGGTLTFSNWNTRLRATNVNLTGGTLTTPLATNNSRTNRVWIIGTNFTLGTSASINVDYKGYYRLTGPGAGSSVYSTSYGSGAGYGGKGRYDTAGSPGGGVYGDFTSPVPPGSGGGHPLLGGAGGGAVRIESPGGTATVHGVISARGQNAISTHGGGGSGGAIYITCKVLGGSTNGLLRVSGGGGSASGSAAGGGRIAVVYTPANQLAFGDPGVRMQATGGVGGFRSPGQDGTVYLPNAQFAASPVRRQHFLNCMLYLGSLTNIGYSSLTVSNASFVFANTGIVVRVTNNVIVHSGGSGVGVYGKFYCGSNMQVRNTSTFYAYAGPTNATWPQYGSLVAVTGLVVVGTNSWVYPMGDENTGNSVKFRLGALTVQSSGGFNADQQGYARLKGPGAGSGNSPFGGGGGYGGEGAVYNGDTNKAKVYGGLYGPPRVGSGGGHSTLGAHGGGLVWIEATGTVSVAGTLSANGETAVSTHGGGGSGGGVFITCRRFEGQNSGLVRAQGGNGDNGGGAGGGGRIAVVYNPTAQAKYNPRVRFSAMRGPSPNAYGVSRQSEHGTIYFPDASFLSTNMTSSVFSNGYVYVSNFTSWAVGSLDVSYCSFAFGNTGLAITVTNTVRILAGGSLGISAGSTFNCRNLIVTNMGSLHVYGAPTNGTTVLYGAQVNVTEDIGIGAGSWIYPWSHRWNGGSPIFRMRNLTIPTSAGFDADGRGFLWGQGYGKGAGLWGGGGHGGKGGTQSGYSGGLPYGRRDSPVHPGSGGGTYVWGGCGGGVIRIKSTGTVTLNGTLKAAGESGISTHGAGAAGGTIFLDCKTLNASATAQMVANGGDGNGNGAAGGGGRIAIWRFRDISTGAITTNVLGGVDASPPPADGSNGTVFVVITAPAITNLAPNTITDTSAKMVGQLTATGYTATAVSCFWGETDGGTNYSAWQKTNSFGVKRPGIFTNSVSGLTPGTVYHYRWYATNTHGEAWGTPTKIFATTGGGVTVNNGSGATNITPVSATLRGMVAQGNPTPTAYICWGTANGGGSSTAAWQHVVSAGSVLGAFSTGISNLLANKTYYYRCYATNGVAGDWADWTTNLTTRGPYISVANTSVGEGNSGTTNMIFTVSLSATSIVDVTVNFATSNGTATAGTDYVQSNGTVTIPSNSTSVTVTVKVNGDTSDEYPYERFYLLLSSPVNGQIGTGIGTGKINDDDGVPATKTWSGTGLWTDPARWSPSGKPRPIDDAVISSGNALLSGPETVAVVTVQSGATITFTNWTTFLRATNITVQGGGLITHGGPFNAPTIPVPIAMSNRIHIICGNLTVNTNGQIHANSKGYTPTYGPGAGANESGAGHGGKGGRGRSRPVVGAEYDTPAAPFTAGSGGSAAGDRNGGGAIRIEASGTVKVWGTISANAVNTGSDAGAGAGGSIWINCDVLAGSTNGLLQANGGAANGVGGSGAGGRIAVVYNTVSQAAAGNPGVRMQTAAGTTGRRLGQDGTVYLPNTQFISTTIEKQLFRNVRLFIPGFTSWSPASLTLNKCSLTFGEPNFVLTVAGNTTLNQGGLGLTGNFRLNCAGKVTLTNSSSLSLYSGPTNGANPVYGGLMAVTGMIDVANGCWIYPYSDITNGGSVKIKAGEIRLASGGGINADRKGYTVNRGPGAGENGGSYGGGAGYGGYGAMYQGGLNRGKVYGSLSAPTSPGSGGSELNLGGAGGGLIWLDVPTGIVYVAGSLTADGEDYFSTHAGGGSGGGIYVNCRRIEGTSSGLIRARGGAGNASGASGGGGRLAVIYNTGAQAGYNPGIKFDTSRGVGGVAPTPERESEDGTLYLPDKSFLSGTLSGGQYMQVWLTIPGFTNWSLDGLTIDNTRIAFAATNLVISITNDLALQNSAAIGIVGRSSLSARDMSLSGNSYLVVRSGPTNTATPDYGVFVQSRRNMTLASGSWIYPYSDPTNGGSPIFLVRNITIQTNAGFNADGKGYRYEQGPGIGTVWSGGGYGGKGGNGASGVGGSPYGITNAPIRPGSGGRYNRGGGNGGGVVRIEASGIASVSGILRANGNNNWELHGGGGSGGSVLLACDDLVTTANTRLWAYGGNGTGNGGGAGGGRIAVWYDTVNPIARAQLLAGQTNVYKLQTTNNYPLYLGTVSVTNGTGVYNPPDIRGAKSGSVIWLKVPSPKAGFLFLAL